VGVLLDGHEVHDLDAARRADAAEVVAAEVDEHEVLRAFLGVGEELRGELGILLRAGTARAGAGDRVQDHLVVGDLHERFRTGADDVEAVEPQQERQSDSRPQRNDRKYVFDKLPIL